MTERRPSNETICIHILKGFLANPQIMKSLEDLATLIEKAMCLGEKCQMFNVNVRGCGLRFR